MSQEELLERFERIGYKEEELGAEKSEIRQELGIRLKKEKLDSKLVGEWMITIYSATRFSTTLAQARELGAIKTEEIVDLGKLKKLHSAGAKVPGVQTKESLRIAKLREKNDNS